MIELAADLSGQIPGLPNIFARKFINRAMTEVKREKLWTWNTAEGVIITPQIISSGGLVSVTQFSPTITFDATSIMALLPYVLANPPLTQRQFRIGPGPIYNIIGYNPTTGVATLDRIYGEATAPTQQYSIYRCYYGAPSNDGTTPVYDFLRYLVINNPIQGYVIAGRRLNMSREEINRRDPLRGAIGNPYYTAMYKPTPNTGNNTTSPNFGQMQYEFWPHPTYQQSLIATYERLHVDLQPTDYFPNQCPTLLVTYKALEFGYRWAMQNAARLPELKGVNWLAALTDVKAQYRIELVSAKRNDSEISPTILRPGSGGLYDYIGPIDSNFAQSHGVSWL